MLQHQLPTALCNTVNPSRHPKATGPCLCQIYNDFSFLFRTSVYPTLCAWHNISCAQRKVSHSRVQSRGPAWEYLFKFYLILYMLLVMVTSGRCMNISDQQSYRSCNKWRWSKMIGSTFYPVIGEKYSVSLNKWTYISMTRIWSDTEIFRQRSSVTVCKVFSKIFHTYSQAGSLDYTR